MPQPFNYSINIPDPSASMFDKMQSMYAISSLQQQEEAKRIAMAQALQQQQQQREMQADLNELSKNPTVEGIGKAIIKYPQLSEHYKRAVDILSTEEKQARLSEAQQAHAAILSGQPEVAADYLAKQAEAHRNNGDEKTAKSLEGISEQIRQNPNAANTSIGTFIASIVSPEKYVETFSAYEKGQRERDLQPEEIKKKAADIKNIESQISERAGRLALDKDKLRSDIEMKLYELDQKKNPSLNLGEDARKIINTSSANSVTSEQTANKMNDLASRFEKSGGGYGAFGGLAEFAKKTTGEQDYMTSLRQEYVRMRASEVGKNLPPGSASDKDIQIAMSGFPSETSDAKYIASFLRGMAKINSLNASTENAKSEWVNSVGHLGKPKEDIEIDGVKVPAGTTFSNFARQYVEKKAEEKSIGQPNIQNRSYMRFAGQQ